MDDRPLHGEKTHPLSEHAKDVLRSLALFPAPQQSINPGVVNRLKREDLVEVIKRPSPYKTHNGKLIDFLRPTPAGFDVINS